MADIKAAVEFGNMLDALKKDELDTTFETQEVTKLIYTRDSELGSVEFQGRAGRLNLTDWSARQLCRLSGVPYGVWNKATGTLAASMLQEFLPMVKEPQRKLVIRSFGNKVVLRGLLPIDYPDIRNSEVLQAVGDAVNGTLIVQSASWIDQTNAPLFRTRFVLPHLTFKMPGSDEDLYLGLDCLSSELGGAPLTINLLLFVPRCTNGAIQVFNKKSYFMFDYSEHMAVDINDILQAAVTRLADDMDLVRMRIEAALKVKASLAAAKELITNMAKEGQINKGVSIKTIGEMEKEGVTNMWDVGNAMTSIARGYRDQLRLKYEIAGGALLGLTFDRRQKEEDWAVKIPAYRLPGDTTSTQIATLGP